MRERKTKTANSNTCYYTIFKTFAGKMVSTLSQLMNYNLNIKYGVFT